MNEPPGLCAPDPPPSRLRLLKKRSREPTATNPQDRVDAIARSFAESQQRSPAIGSPFGLDEPSPEQVDRLLRQHASKHPEKSRAALELYHAVREGRLVPIED